MAVQWSLYSRSGKCLFKIDITLYYPEAAADVLQTQPHITFIQLIKISLYQSAAIVMDAHIEFIGMYVLGKMDKGGAAVFKYIIDQLLYDTEYDQFFFSAETLFVFMETAAGVDGT